MESRMTNDENETEEWIDERGDYHRDDGPATIFANGTRFWYQNGFLHRADGPAVILENGSEYWYQNGFLHREDGPARIWPDGRFEWRLNDKELSFTEWANELNLDSTQRLMMVLKWNPE